MQRPMSDRVCKAVIRKLTAAPKMFRAERKTALIPKLSSWRIKPFRIGARNGLQCLNWKQPAQRRQADLKQAVAEMAHEFRKTTPQTIALLLIDGERALR